MLGLERLIPWRPPRRVPETRPQVSSPPTSESSASERDEQQGALDRARARASLARDFVSRIEQQPGTLYGERREDAMEDLLLGEVALDLLTRQSTMKTVVRDRYKEGRGGRMVLVDSWELPERVQIAGKTLEVGEILGAGGFGVVVESGEYVVKFVRASGDNTDSTFLSFVAREISALARFNPLPEADPVFLQGMEAAQLRPRQTRTTDRIPGFLGATRVAFPVEFGEEIHKEEYIAVAMERVAGRDLDEALYDGVTYESVRPETYRELTRQIAQALAAFHEARTLHRDVKTSNVMVSFPASGQVDAKLTDMGLAVDTDYRARVRNQTVHSQLFIAAAAVREHLLELSLADQFNQDAEEVWLELAALIDRVDAGETIPRHELDRFVEAELIKDLPKMAKPPVARQAFSALGNAFLAAGTKSFMDGDTLAGTPTTASDVYALGVTVATFLIVTAHRRRGEIISFEEALVQMATEDLSTSSIVLSELGGDDRARRMAGLLKSMIARDASKRPANAMEVLRALDEIERL